MAHPLRTGDPDQRPLAIFGGTFDPVHLGHLRAAWESSLALDADVLMMPANVPPHRSQPMATAAQRLALLQIALTGQDRLRIDARELDRDGRSYSIDTLIDVRDEVGPTRPLVLLVGRDAFAGLPSWHRWRELFDHAHVGVMSRPGIANDWSSMLVEEIAKRTVSEACRLRDQPAGLVIDIAVTALDISATRIRHLLAAGDEPRFLLPDRLIDQSGLLSAYRSVNR